MADSGMTSKEPQAQPKRSRRRWLAVVLCALVVVGSFCLLHYSTLRRPQWARSEYVDSGRYHRDLIRQLRGARSYIDFRLRQNARRDIPQHLAVVMAIDETALVDDSVYRYHTRSLHRYTVMMPVRALYDYAKARGVSIFFVSARQRRHLGDTVMHLHQAGYRQWDGLLLAPEQTQDISSFKRQQRAAIEKMGYKIILNIGSNPLDLRGNYAELPVLLPTPYRLY